MISMNFGMTGRLRVTHKDSITKSNTNKIREKIVKKLISIFLSAAIVLAIFTGEVSAKNFDDNRFSFFEWNNPTPCFSDIHLNLKDVCSIIGNSQMLIQHNGKTIDVFTCKDNTGKGEVQTYNDLRFVTSLIVINKSRKEVISAYMDYEKYPQHFPQYPEAGIIKSQGNQYLLGMRQVYKLMLFSLKADFRYLYKKEANGDLSYLLLDGDVGAGVGRMEFIAIDENKTLVASTQWLDLDTAKFVFRTVIKAQPDLKVTAPLAACAMLSNQYREMIEGEIRPSTNIESLPSKPEIPIYATGNIPVKTFRQLTELGTLTFVYPKQWIQTEQGPKCMEFISSATRIPGDITQSKPYSSDFTRFNEYIKQAKKVEISKKDNGYSDIDWNLKIGLGFVGLNIDYETNSHWINENTALFEGTGGDIEPIFGAWEWIDLNNNNTLVLFTAAVNISDNASWIVKLGNKVPNAHIIAGIFMGTLIVENQAEWIEQQFITDGINRKIALK